jgi:hypothetical protein
VQRHHYEHRDVVDGPVALLLAGEPLRGAAIVQAELARLQQSPAENTGPYGARYHAFAHRYLEAANQPPNSVPQS